MAYIDGKVTPGYGIVSVDEESLIYEHFDV